MKVGITGATGFIGKYLIRDYGKDIEFVAPVIESPTELSGAKYMFSDYSVDSLSEIFEGCEAVIHLAAKVAKQNNVHMSMDEYIKNTDITANVFEACKKSNIKKIIHASSRTVFDWKNIGNDKINEDMRPTPKNAYGVSKVCDEILASYYNDVYDMKIKSYRMAEVCGLDFDRGFINAFWKVALEKCLKKEPIPVYGRGVAGRDLLYVKDAAAAFIKGLEIEKKGIFHIGSGKIVSNREIAKAFCREFGNHSEIELHPEKEEWGTNGVLQVEKAKKELGFSISYNLTEIIQDIKKEVECSRIYGEISARR